VGVLEGLSGKKERGVLETGSWAHCHSPLRFFDTGPIELQIIFCDVFYLLGWLSLQEGRRCFQRSIAWFSQKRGQAF
jgi:hypothetical protein